MASTLLENARLALVLAPLATAAALTLVGCAGDDVTMLDDETAEDAEGAAGLGLGAQGEDVRAVYDYLRRFGYYQNDELAEHYPDWTPAVAREPADPELFDEALEEGVRLFQAQYGLPVTGVVDAETQKAMRMPRCGHPDHYVPKSVVPTWEMQGYSHLGGTWSTSSLTYRFSNYTSDLSQTAIRNAIQAAMFRWGTVTNFTFTEVTSGENITIAWNKDDHSCSAGAFDGSGGTLAHAFSPGGGVGGDVHFDDDESWSTSSSSGTHLETVALHELGHSLGLGHSSKSSAVMYASYSGVDVYLGADDHAGIWSRYSAYNAPSGCGTLNAGEGLGKGQSVWSCDGRFQFVFQDDGNLVLYKNGAAIWETDTNGDGADRVIMQEDGNLVMYKSTGQMVWETDSNSTANHYAGLLVQNDGNVVMYRANGGVAWSSGTCCH